MKHLLLPCAVLLLLLGMVLLSARGVGSVADTQCALLQRASDSAAAGDWTDAERTLARAVEAWHSQVGLLHLVVPHSALDEADRSLASLPPYASSRDAESFCAESAALQAHLRALALSQQLTLRNIF